MLGVLTRIFLLGEGSVTKACSSIVLEHMHAIARWSKFGQKSKGDMSGIILRDTDPCIFLLSIGS